MQFKNLKASELDGRVELPGLGEWIEQLSDRDVALLIAAPAGTGKTAAVGAIARKMERDVVQCDLQQVFEYPDSREALRDILTIVENLRSVVFQAEGIGKMGERFRQLGDTSGLELFRDWLANVKERLGARGVVLVATGRDLKGLPEEVRAAFDRVFVAH